MTMLLAIPIGLLILKHHIGIFMLRKYRYYVFTAALLSPYFCTQLPTATDIGCPVYVASCLTLPLQLVGRYCPALNLLQPVLA